MKANQKLIRIKTIHTLIWVFYIGVLAYLAYAVIANKIDYRVWIGLGAIVFEGMVLLIFNRVCPLTIIARKYSQSTKDNFDIFLPNWLAKYNKLIYIIVFIIVFFGLIYRLLVS